MAEIVFEGIQNGNKEVLADLRRIVNDDKFNPQSFKDIVSNILVTSYLGSKNSSTETLGRAKRVADQIGSHHFNMNIDESYEAIVKVFERETGKTPKYESHGGTYTEDVAL